MNFDFNLYDNMCDMCAIFTVLLCRRISRKSLLTIRNAHRSVEHVFWAIIISLEKTRDVCEEQHTQHVEAIYINEIQSLQHFRPTSLSRYHIPYTRNEKYQAVFIFISSSISYKILNIFCNIFMCGIYVSSKED